MTTKCHDYLDIECSLTVSLLAVPLCFFTFVFHHFTDVIPKMRFTKIPFNRATNPLLIANKLHVKFSFEFKSLMLINVTEYCPELFSSQEKAKTNIHKQLKFCK